jgi:two-component system LytT family sensor kinase
MIVCKDEGGDVVAVRWIPSKQKLRQILFVGFLCLLLIPFFATWIGYTGKESCVRHEAGLFDVSRCNIEQRPTKLDGQWLFFDDQLMGSKRFVPRDTQSTSSFKPDIVQVPNHWSNPVIPWTQSGAKGHGTYQIQLQLSDASVGEPLALRFSSIRVASRVFVNGKPIGGSGTVGVNKKSERPLNRPFLVRITPERTTLTLQVEVSNYSFFVGGINNSVSIGTLQMMESVAERYKAFDILTIGILCGVALFYLGQMMFIERYRENLLFSLLATTIALFYSTQSEKWIYDVFPMIEYEWFNQLAMISGYFVHTLTLLYLNQSRPNLVSTAIIRVVILLSFVLLPVFLLADSGTASYLTGFISLYAVSIDILVIILLYRSYRSDRDGLHYLSIAAVAALLYVIISILNFQFAFEVYDFPPIYIPVMVISFGLVLSERQSLMQQRLMETELDKFRHQIKPHFIYNSLNTIMWMNKRDTKKTQDLLFDFSQFLRASFDFDGNESLVLFKNELETTRAYLSLEQARFGEKLRVQWKLEVMEFSLPPLLLQPIVENAVRHGVTSGLHGGTIDVETFVTGEYILIRVSDDGPGFSQAFLDEWSHGKKEASGGGKGIGLVNVHQRLKTIFQTSLQIENRAEGGARVTILLPKG